MHLFASCFPAGHSGMTGLFLPYTSPYQASQHALTTTPQELYGKPVHIWTDEEIQCLPCTGNWFYGLVRQEDGRIVLSEIHPSIGRSDFELSKENNSDRSDKSIS